MGTGWGGVWHGVDCGAGLKLGKVLSGGVTVSWKFSWGFGVEGGGSVQDIGYVGWDDVVGRIGAL